VKIIRLALLSFLIAAPLLQAQQSNATQYGQVFNNVSTVTGKVLVLFGTEGDQAFLKGMAAAQHKGTFICDNIDAQQTRSQAFALGADSKFTWNLSGSTWPVNDTVVVCGTVTFQQSYRNDSVDTTFKFGAWGSAIAYPGVTQQVPSLTFSFVDYCPQNTQNCETSALHPEPEMPMRTAHVSGSVRAHDCAGKAEITGGSVQVVLNTTAEGRDFNRSTAIGDVCDAIPKSFQDDSISSSDTLDSGHARIRFSLDISIRGRSVPAYLYVCADVDRYKGSDKDSCEDDSTSTHIFRKVAITLQPNQTINVDEMYHDYTR
jgi:hypothetical protein